MRPSDPVVDVRHLCKTFGRVEALRGLDLTVHRGEVHGFLGPNGAGKSTTLRVLLGLVRATSGHVRVLGEDPWADAVPLHRRMAYVPGDVTVWPSLTGGEIIDLLGRLRGRVDTRRRDELIDRFSLDPARKARTYSTGNRQKVALIAAFASDAELIVLDEPTSGLDPLMEQVFADCVRAAVARGATVLLSSHILSEVDSLCERVTIVRDGATVESGSLADMRHLTRVRVVADVRTVPDVTVIPGEVSVDGSTVSASVDRHRLPELMRVLADAGVTRLDSAPPTLEDLFLGYYDAR